MTSDPPPLEVPFATAVAHDPDWERPQPRPGGLFFFGQLGFRAVAHSGRPFSSDTIYYLPFQSTKLLLVQHAGYIHVSSLRFCVIDSQHGCHSREVTLYLIHRHMNTSDNFARHGQLCAIIARTCRLLREKQPFDPAWLDIETWSPDPCPPPTEPRP